MALRIQHWFFKSIIKRKNRELLKKEEMLRKEREALQNRFGIKEHLKTIIEENNMSTSITNIAPTPEKAGNLPKPIQQT